MTRTILLVVGTALLALGLPARALAQGVTFDVPAECGSEAAMDAELGRLVGAEAERAHPTLLRIAWDGAEHAYRLTLAVGGRERELLHADCRVLFRSAIVIAAASVKPAEPALVASPPIPVPAPPTSAGSAAAQAPPPRAARSDGAVRGSFAAGVGLALGVVPGVAGGFELRGAVATHRVGASLAVRYFPPRPVAVEGRDAEIHALGLRAAGVYEPASWLALSVGLDADWLSGSGGEGVTAPRTDSAWTLGPSAEIATIPLRTRHLAIELAAEGRLALVRPVFEVTGFRELYQVPSFGMLLVARGVWLFP